MTKQELNRDIKRLNKKVGSFDATPEYYKYLDNEFKAEFRRLYGADKEFKYMSKRSVLIMLRLNVKYTVVPLHMFGICIEL